MSPRIVFYFIAGIIILFCILAIYGSIESKRAAKRIAQILIRIEKKYEELLMQKTSYSILANNSLDFDILLFSNEIKTILKPDIDGLIAQLNATNYSRLNIEIKLDVFQNIGSLCESLLILKKKEISPQQKEQLIQSITDCIHSNLSQKKLEMQLGV